MAFLLKRNTSVICSSVESGWNSGNTARLNLVDETFSYSQSSSISESTRNQLGSSDRGSSYFVDSVAPAQFAFSTYLSASSGIIPDELLWEAFTNSSITGISPIDFTSSNVSQLPNLFFWFDHQGTTYKLTEAVLQSASISLNLEGLPIVTWTGTARTLGADTAPVTFTDHKGSIPEVIGKLTTISFSRNPAAAKVYTLALTDFELSIENNVQWVSRTRLGTISVPEAHYLGNRSLEGSMTMYLKTGTSQILLDDLLADLVGNTEYTYDAFISLGGATNFVTLDMPNLIINAPQTNIDEAVTLSVPFRATETAATTGDEITITFS